MDLVGIENLLARLNEDQLKVANIGPGPCAVIGGPGSGKTTAMVARIARLARDGLSPQYVLAMTFTRSAASTLNERLTALGVAGGRISTIHSLSLDIIRDSAPGMLSSNTLDENGFKTGMQLEQALGDLRRDKVISRGLRPDLDGVKRFMCFAKASDLCPIFGNPLGLNADGEDAVYELAKGFKHISGGLNADQLLHLYTHLEHRRAAARLYDFDDMQLWAFMILMAMPDELQRWRKMWMSVMVDEAQDSSAIQWDIARLLGGGSSRIRPSMTPNDSALPPNLMTLGQVSQCLAPDTQITTAGGDTTHLLSDVQEGGGVATSVGGDYAVFSSSS